MRKNDKEILLDFENSIFKSNELSMAKLNQGLTLNQMQLLAFAIYSTQKNGQTEFHKVDFENKFNIERYPTNNAKRDTQKISGLQFSVENLEDDYFEFWNVFGSIKYKSGLFTFRWNEEFVPHILELKEKYITTDLTITSQFKSGFSWLLYDFLKAHYGYWHKPISKDALMRLFNVESKKTYKKNTGDFKKMVLNVAINEINRYTEYEVWYKEEKEGRAIVGFDLYWSNGEVKPAATEKQVKELKTIMDSIFMDLIKYLSLNDKVNKQRVLELIEEINGIRKITEDTICITKEKANVYLQRVNWISNELERLLIVDKETPYVSYNWLDN